jgi:hypothetical protein
LIGVNTSAAVLGGARALIGREDGLSLIDFRDPPGEDEMPVRLRIDSNRSVAQVATNRDGSTILVRLLEGGIASVDLASRSLVPHVGDGILPTRPWPLRDPAAEPPQEPEPEPPAPAEPLVIAAPSTPPERETEAGPPPETRAGLAAEELVFVADDPSTETADPAPPAPVAADGAGVTTSVDDEAVAAAEEPVPEVVAAADEPVPPTRIPPADSGPSPQVHGKLDGPGAARVSAVVLFGPDNILREAKRVTPDSDGQWQVDGLQPGRYRIQLAGDGESTPVADPPFHVVEIESGRPTSTASFQVLEPR